MGCIQCCQPSVVSFLCEHTLTGHLPGVMTKSLSHGTSVCARVPEGHNLDHYQPDQANVDAILAIKILTIHGLWNPHIFFCKFLGVYRRWVRLDGAQVSKRMLMRWCLWICFLTQGCLRSLQPKWPKSDRSNLTQSRVSLLWTTVERRMFHQADQGWELESHSEYFNWRIKGIVPTKIQTHIKKLKG